MRTAPRPARRLLATAGLALLLLGTAAGCSGSSDDQTGTMSSPDKSATMQASSTTTAKPTTTTAPTTTTVAAPVGAGSPEDATAQLYAAFQAGDRAAAAKVAEPAAIDAVFAAVPGPYQPYRGCDTAEFGTSGCLYRDRSTNHTIQFDLEKRGTVWVVTNGFYSAD
ncbi:hypothetical protein KSP35_07020 [Aquihabitans sp. G128]|uniref:hypothetical protein n=1 Tax=Aquihabitans sp. G128 TaxID=2849779 RepID=UPI001C2190C3|nr:hypothetical protein [Aquihabitans sp. G128]QXC62543.1 hypothetical protein KSP35_07020 [Aquihabitans sp. G128]